MEVEAISNASSNFSPAEAPKVSVSKPEPVEVSRAVAAPESTPAPVSQAEKKQNGEQDAKRERAASEASIDDAVKSANRKMERTRCEYSYHKETNRVSIKVMDADTDEVIREIPPEKSLDMLQKMWEMAGILVDERR
ncbi:MAG: flagellar protein FlaG [Lachnospiraceae bacterium]|nr:flagellar protein FlaG [Lachnospiraceae bacterium]